MTYTRKHPTRSDIFHKENRAVFEIDTTLSQEWSGNEYPRTAMCVRNVDVHVSCSSQVDAQLAAFFIDPRAKWFTVQGIYLFKRIPFVVTQIILRIRTELYVLFSKWHFCYKNFIERKIRTQLTLFYMHNHMFYKRGVPLRGSARFPSTIRLRRGCVKHPGGQAKIFKHHRNFVKIP